MKLLIQWEIKKIIFPYLIGLFLSVVFSVVSIHFVSSGYQYNYNIEVWIQSGEIFTLLFPLFVTIPTCWLMFFERKNSFITYTINRVEKNKYLFTKWLVSALGGAFIVLSASLTGLIVCLFFIPNIQPTKNDYAIENFAGYYFVHKPFLYGLILSLWKSVIGFLIASLGFVLSLFANNIFIILTGPFVYLVLENFILAILKIPYFRLVTSFDPTTLTPDAISIGRLAVGPLLLIIFVTILLYWFVMRKKEQIYPV